MKRITAVVYGVGEMNSLITRLLLDKDVEIVGAIARSPAKVGTDLGIIVGLGHELGIVITDDADALLASTSPDVAMIAVNSYMTDARTQLELCARHGVNAITLSEEALFPWDTAPGITAELDGIAKSMGVTLTGGGHQDAFWVNMVTTLMGTAHRIATVRGHASWNVDDFGPEVARDQRVDTTVGDFRKWAATTARPPTFGRNALDAIVSATGLTVESIELSTRPDTSSRDVASTALGRVVEAGRVVGFTDITRVHTVEGIEFVLAMSGRVYGPGDTDVNEWTIEGEPTLTMSNGVVPTRWTTCTQLVNRIPDVINAPAGFVTIDRLPAPRYRAFPLHTYLTEASERDRESVGR